MIIDSRKPAGEWFKYLSVGEKMKCNVLRLGEQSRDKDVVEAVMSIGDDETLVVPYTYHIIPDALKKRNGVMIENPSSVQFKKHGKEVFLPTPDSRDDAIVDRLDPQNLMHDRFNRVLMGGRCRGYGWRGISRNRQLRLVPLTSAIDGYGMYIFFDDVGKDLYRSQGHAPKMIYEYEYGEFSIVKVSSRTRNVTHRIRLDMLPIDKECMHADWTEIAAASTSEEKTYREISHRYVSPEILFTDEVVAAYRKTQKERDMHAYPDPIAIPSALLVEYNDNITNNLVVEHEKNGKIKKANPNEAEREILLWKFLGYKNMQAAGGNGAGAYESLFRRDHDGVADYMVKIK
ncbi:MAG: hypothetical protein HZB67_04200 [Candidatus Aenigmarchaeota archaeon]|nr:hypothetical protein [Candidatus Aenigmarchaeota archaeon]